MNLCSDASEVWRGAVLPGMVFFIINHLLAIGHPSPLCGLTLSVVS